MMRRSRSERGTSAAALLLALTASAVFLPPSPAAAAILRVGPGKTFSTVRAAAQAARDGDLVLIDPGVYEGDVTAWHANDLLVRGVGTGRAHMRAAGAQEGGKGTWVVYGRNFTVENIEFSGARVPDENGAGIRADIKGKLTVRRCVFQDNENGILAGADTILIDRCVFDRNGKGDGRSHNLYVWGASVTILGTETRRARVGHNIKTRGQTNYILYNRIMDEADGTASYSIDVPDCGRTYIIGNVVEQGPRTENYTLVSYGAESGGAVQDLYVVHNTFVNHREKGGVFLQLREGAPATVRNNIFYGPGVPWEGGKVRAGRNYVTRSLHNAPRFEAPGSYDFHLTARTPKSIRDAGGAPGRSATGYDLTPKYEYVHRAQGRARTSIGPPDLGAFEAPAAPHR